MPKLIILTFCGFGFLCLAISVGMAWYISRSLASDHDFLRTAKTTNGKIIGYVEKRAGIEVGETATANFPRIEFFVEGTRYEIVSNVAAPPLYFWEEVTVAYDPANPNDAKLNSAYFRFFHQTIAALFAAFFTVVGFVMIGWGAWSPAKNLFLWGLGKEVSAKVVGFREANNWGVQNTKPWVVDLEWTDQSGKTWIFTSEGLWINPSEDIPIGSQIPVYVIAGCRGGGWVKLPERVLRKNPLFP